MRDKYNDKIELLLHNSKFGDKKFNETIVINSHSIKSIDYQLF